jgi:glyoxylase-like metal-dependent hydrolase (beta-lactamase superfamily II)
MNWGLIMSPVAQGHFEDLPVFMFLIEGEDGEKIIVDGSYQHDSVPKFIFGPHRTPDLEVPEVLRRYGVDPASIDTVVVTHLHHDHTGYLRLFEKADFYVQELELINAYNPMGYQTIGYWQEDWLDLTPRFKLLNGTVRGGIAGKKVDLEDPEVKQTFGRVLNARFGGYFGPSILNPGDIMRTLAKLDLMADIVIPGHDPELVRMKGLPDDYDLETR